jgi:hypothetical protein
LENEIVCVHISLLAIFIGGFLLFLYPEPRFSIRGYFSRRAFGKLLIVSSILGGLELLLCPHFVFTHQKFGGAFAFLNGIVNYFESRFGHDVCSLFCGFIFSTLVSLISLLFVFKNLSYLKMRPLILSLICSSIAFLPIVLIHLIDDHLRAQLEWWAMGAFIGIALIAFIFSTIGWVWVRFLKKKVTFEN